MDPNAALQSILSGHLIADHAEALRDWLRSGGFPPQIALPADCHPAFSSWPKWPARVTADYYTGLSVSTSERVAGLVVETVHHTMRWEDVLKLEESEY